MTIAYVAYVYGGKDTMKNWSSIACIILPVAYVYGGKDLRTNWSSIACRIPPVADVAVFPGAMSSGDQDLRSMPTSNSSIRKKAL